MILFQEIFSRAINLFDDPDINHAYVHNPVAFDKLMRPFLINGIAKFTNPIAISSALQYQDEPEGQLEIFEGNGGSEYDTKITPRENSSMVFLINGKPDNRASYNSESKKVIFSRNIETSEEGAVEWYYAGSFTKSLQGIFPNVPIETILNRIYTILAHCLMVAWAEKNKNFILEIRNLLTDTDFKIHSPANSLNSKVNWCNNLNLELQRQVSKLAWDVRVAGIGGRRLG